MYRSTVSTAMSGLALVRSKQGHWLEVVQTKDLAERAKLVAPGQAAQGQVVTKVFQLRHATPTGAILPIAEPSP
jgi:hypothetical protein